MPIKLMELLKKKKNMYFFSPSYLILAIIYISYSVNCTLNANMLNVSDTLM